MNETAEIILAGNPNVGKSTVFNSLTGLNQHTGNWCGKTVSAAEGYFETADSDGNKIRLKIVDLPGIYSLRCNSAEEEAAFTYLKTHPSSPVVYVCAGAALERNLLLLYQIKKLNPAGKILLCVNLMDEAREKGVEIDFPELSKSTSCPAVPVTAKTGEGMDELKKAIQSLLPPAKFNSPEKFSTETTQTTPSTAEIPNNFNHPEKISTETSSTTETPPETPPIFNHPANISTTIPPYSRACTNCGLTNGCPLCKSCTHNDNAAGFSREVISRAVKYTRDPSSREAKIDRIVCGKHTAAPIMLLLLLLVFWLTLEGSSHISGWLETASAWLLSAAAELCKKILPDTLTSLICGGVLATVLKVISVMLPPMAVFFPLFTLLEDLGYLPRVAFSLDSLFEKCGVCGKQSLTMLMGLGCNAVGVTGCRIIDSPRERRIAMITNTLIPCNGRFPLILACISTLSTSGMVSSILLTTVVGLAILSTLVISKILSSTVFRGEPSYFTLELPPYRMPKVGEVLIRSLLDRVVHVLTRALSVAAPAGLLIWLLGYIKIGDQNLLLCLADLLDPLGRIMGLNGGILLAFIAAFPAAELILPVLFSLGSTGTLESAFFGGAVTTLGEYFSLNNLGLTSAVCLIILTVFHYPCATTLLTIRRESGRWSDVFISALLPTAVGVILCITVNLLSTLFT